MKVKWAKIDDILDDIIDVYNVLSKVNEAVHLKMFLSFNKRKNNVKQATKLAFNA